MSEEHGSRHTISLKERARLARRAAYQRAKEARAKDPRVLALKEAAKKKRKEIYQELKAKRKAERKVEKKEDEKRRTEARDETRKANFGELMKLVKKGAGGAAHEPEETSAREIPTAGPPELRLVASNTPRKRSGEKRPALRLVEKDGGTEATEE
ncbi:MAG TPA: hypothetical protein VHE30_14820 [Polyangiaceae bacterium]|nr:hypothetical protein [Polyangiaceae bacterium]